jgi:hypothetical protein
MCLSGVLAFRERMQVPRLRAGTARTTFSVGFGGDGVGQEAQAWAGLGLTQDDHAVAGL